MFTVEFQNICERAFKGWGQGNGCFLYIQDLYVIAHVMYTWYVYICGHFIITSSHYCTRNSANLIVFI